MKPEITAKISGKPVKLAMPIGGLERIAEINPQLGEVATCILGGAWKLAELRVVVETGLEFGGSDLTFEDAYEAEGLRRLAEIGAELMLAAFGPLPEKKHDQAATPLSE